MKITLKQIIFSWDFLASLAILIFFSVILDGSVSSEFSKDVYGVGISVLSIVFSVYFAALALIITSGDDDFVHFLEEEGDYTGIIDTFKFSLLALFTALLYSIIVYIYTASQIYQVNSQSTRIYQPQVFLLIFSFLFSYGLFAALKATLDSISYALFRVSFLNARRNSAATKNNNLNDINE